MAVERHRRQSEYRSSGNVAYDPGFDGNTARPVPKRKETPKTKPRHRTERKNLTRKKVRVREAGQVAPFAVVGFMLVGAMTALLLWYYAQYTVLTDQVVSLRNSLSKLETEYATLFAEYEQVFDMERIQSAVGGSMVRPSASQIEYIDLSEPDSVELYHGTGGMPGIVRVLDGIGDMISVVIEYFR